MSVVPHISVQEMAEEIAEALQPLQDQIPDLQITAYWNPTPSPPSIDVYPGTPFQDGAAFAKGSSRIFFTVRARCSMGDPESATQLLLRLLDPGNSASVEGALWDVDWAVTSEGVNGFTRYADDVNANEAMLGTEWRVQKFT